MARDTEEDLEEKPGRFGYIYGLVSEKNPDEIRYIGKTVNPEDRYNQHMVDKEDTKRARWIRNEIKNRRKIEMSILERCSTRMMGLAERKWISYYSYMGHRLLNSDAASVFLFRNKLREMKRNFFIFKILLSLCLIFAVNHSIQKFLASDGYIEKLDSFYQVGIILSIGVLVYNIYLYKKSRYREMLK